jgi:hypothetical protein
VFEFENTPSDNADEATDVIAKIRFRSLDDKTEEQIPYGVWLNATLNSVDMGIGDTRELVVLCVNSDRKLCAFSDRRSVGHGFHSAWSWFDTHIVEGMESVEIRILDQKTGTVKKFVRRVSFDGEQFQIGPDLIR